MINEILHRLQYLERQEATTSQISPTVVLHQLLGKCNFEVKSIRLFVVIGILISALLIDSAPIIPF